MPDTSNRRSTWGARLGIALLSLLILCASHYGAYRLALDTTVFSSVSGVRVPAYRWRWFRWVHHTTVKSFFYPAFLVDRELRPKRWKRYAGEKFDAIAL